MTSPGQREVAEVDLARLWEGVLRRLPAVVITATLLGLLAFTVSLSQPKLYQATASLIALATSDGGNQFVPAPPLPKGAVEQALLSEQVYRPLLQAIARSDVMPRPEQGRLRVALAEEISRFRLRSVVVRAPASQVQPNGQAAGIYEVVARASTPQSAQALANLAAAALVQWDTQRLIDRLRQAQSVQEQELKQANVQLALAGIPGLETVNALEQQVWLRRRAELEGNLNQIRLQLETPRGVLTSLASATAPNRAAEPQTVRNVILAVALSAAAGLVVSVLFSALDRSVRSARDLEIYHHPTLALLPGVRRHGKAWRNTGPVGQSLEPAAFLRVYLGSRWETNAHPVVVVIGVSARAGSAAASADIARTFVHFGQRVLWIAPPSQTGTPIQHAVPGEAFQGNSLPVQADRLNERLHVLPASDLLGAAEMTDQQQRDALFSWKAAYDLVVVDGGDRLDAAGTLQFGRVADAVVFAVGAGQSSLTDVERAMRRAEQLDFRVVGFILTNA